MKRLSLIALSLLTASVAGAAISDRARARCFHESTSKKTITFVFDNSLWNAGTVNSVDVRGSFTGWGKDSKFELTYDDAEKCWTVTRPYTDVRIPGNSGQPEFKFVVNGSNWLSGSGKTFIPEGYVFNTSDKNNILVFADDDLEQIKANSKTAGNVKKASEFDVSTRQGKEEISNFRLVPGTTALFRCYHPFKWSRDQYDSEPVRIALVKELSEAEGIKSDICLSGDDTNKLTSYTVAGKKYDEQIPGYYRDILDAGNVLYVGTANGHTPSYNEVYYNPTGQRLGQWMKETVDFINSSPAPFTIHCRLGTDRTGMFSALLAAICGATWKEITDDYQMSNRMAIKEFRDYHLLQYAFQKMLGVENINDVDNLRTSISDYFVKNGYLTDSDLAGVRIKLGSTSTIDTEILAENEEASEIYYTLNGRRVEKPGNGIFICKRGSTVRKIIRR